MNFNEAKNKLEVYKKTLEYSVKMYEATLREMIERNADKNAVSVVLEMKADIENQIREIEASLANVEHREEKTLTGFNETVDKLFKGFNPYFKHRFVVDFGTNEIKDYYITKVNYTDEYLNVVFRDSEEFFTPKYLSKNKHFDTVKVYLLSPLGEKKTTIEFRNVNLETFQQDALSYTRDEDEILTTDVVFKCDVVVYE
jgi:hypothetical protein